MSRASAESRCGFKGNKAALPRKTCAVCAREMVWRRAWAKNWDAVRYCSNACRRAARQARAAAGNEAERGDG